MEARQDNPQNGKESKDQAKESEMHLLSLLGVVVIRM